MLPKSAIAAIKRLVAIGRRMKISDMFTLDLLLRGGRRIRLDLNAASRDQSKLTRGHNAFAFTQPFLDNNISFYRSPRQHRPCLDGHVRLDDKYELSILPSLHRGHRDNDRVRRIIRSNDHAHELTGPEFVDGIIE